MPPGPSECKATGAGAWLESVPTSVVCGRPIYFTTGRTGQMVLHIPRGYAQAHMGPHGRPVKLKKLRSLARNMSPRRSLRGRSATRIAPNPPSSWTNAHVGLSSRVADRYQRAYAAYRQNPLLVEEHANIELATAQGGYGRRQIYELVQNGADALLGQEGGRIQVVLTEEALYCANQGAPIDSEGIDSLLASYISQKRGLEIGRFGLGFKSVLGVTDSPDFFSRSVSFSFDASKSQEILSRIVPEAPHFPARASGLAAGSLAGSRGRSGAQGVDGMGGNGGTPAHSP